MVEIEGTISNRSLSILIDPWDTLSYITPKIMENFHLSKVRHSKPCLVQLDTGEKIKVTFFTVNCQFKIQDHQSRINLNVLPLGSYDMIIGLDFLEKYKVVLNCFDKTFTYVVEDQIVRKIEGIRKHVSLRQISAMQLRSV